MLIRTFQNQAEQQLLQRIGEFDRRNLGHGVLLCRLSSTLLRPSAHEALSFLKPILEDHQAEIYFCADGDIAISWCGKFNAIKEQIARAFLSHYTKELEECSLKDIFQFFDGQAQLDELRRLLQAKLQQSQPVSESLITWTTEPPISWNQQFSDDQLRALKIAIGRRSYAKKPEILVVEDQEFSRRLLLGLFEKDYRCYGAQNAEQAVALYAEHAPEVVFLDVELPDLDGHILASLIKRYDSQSCIVMVTGNSYAKDVEMAKANKVHGFVAKPYNRQKIMGALNTYLQARRRKHRSLL